MENHTSSRLDPIPVEEQVTESVLFSKSGLPDNFETNVELLALAHLSSDDSELEAEDPVGNEAEKAVVEMSDCNLPTGGKVKERKNIVRRAQPYQVTVRKETEQEREARKKIKETELFLKLWQL
jgi:hypothetical protein